MTAPRDAPASPAGVCADADAAEIRKAAAMPRGRLISPSMLTSPAALPHMKLLRRASLGCLVPALVAAAVSAIDLDVNRADIETAMKIARGGEAGPSRA